MGSIQAAGTTTTIGNPIDVAKKIKNAITSATSTILSNGIEYSNGVLTANLTMTRFIECIQQVTYCTTSTIAKDYVIQEEEKRRTLEISIMNYVSRGLRNKGPVAMQYNESTGMLIMLTIDLIDIIENIAYSAALGLIEFAVTMGD